jgi:hypothetical protein
MLVCMYVGLAPGPNPTTSIYNASVVNFYSTTGSLARLESKNILFYFEKCSCLPQCWLCSCKFKNRRIGSRFFSCDCCLVYREAGEKKLSRHLRRRRFFDDFNPQLLFPNEKDGESLVRLTVLSFFNMP